MGHLPRPLARRFALAALVAAVLVAWPATPRAHDIPTDVLVQAFVRPEGRQLTLLVRVPLQAMRDLDVRETPDGFLDLARLTPVLTDAAKIWIADAVSLYEDGTPLPAPRIVAARLSMPADRSFASFEDAEAHLAAPGLDPATRLVWSQPLLDVRLAYAIGSDRSRFSIDPAFARLGIRVATVLRFLPPGGAERLFQYRGDPGVVALDPGWFQAAWNFVTLGFTHILDGLDHLLFLLCLVIPFRRLAPLVLIVTAFTVAHSITLIASALGAVPDRLWFPPLVETLIAASIVYMALENVLLLSRRSPGESEADFDAGDVLSAREGQPRPARDGSLRAALADPRLRRRWVLTFGFGLVHGFGFSFALKESLQFAGAHLLTALFAFNLGVEFGQLAVLVVAVPALVLLFRFVRPARVTAIILSALVAHTAWHWMLDRGRTLGGYAWTIEDVWLLAGAVRWALLLVAGAATLWLARELWGRVSLPQKGPETGQGPTRKVN
ncbi:MAG: HupE/UreJ family protein [Vicinamibacterales bacterium]